MNWISTKTKLPDKKSGLLITFPDEGTVYVARYDGSYWRCIDGCAGYGESECVKDCKLEPTHWMPLPPSPLI